ncbi:MAG TPA: YkgJ family cysteine cluster protein [Usitatibacter sp.]|nr:YkgJ family cysteine cluster protein [Usitatibacter sp.]
MAEPSRWGVEARDAFAGARDAQKLATAVVRFHKRVDEVIDATIQGHAVKIACTRGCSYCCSLQVQVLPHEVFPLADWLRRHFKAERLAAVTARLRDNAAKTRAMGDAERKRSNLACALLGDDGACTAYEARPAQCRRFHSTDVEICKRSFANPADDTLRSPNHPAIAHNASVIVTQANQAVRAEGLDATPEDMNIALLDALENPKAWRRWRDGKKAFVGAGFPPARE